MIKLVGFGDTIHVKKDGWPYRKAVPFINEDFPNVGYSGLITHPSTYADLEYWVKRSPESLAILNAIVTDMISDTVSWDGPKYKQQESEKFWRKSFMKWELKKVFFDFLLYGDGYLWKDDPSLDAELKALINNPLLKAAPEDEHYPLKKVKYVPTTTMSIDFTEVGIKGYRQVVGSKERKWAPEEIIHGQLMNWRGKAYGFSPFMAAIAEIQTLAYLKDYAGTFFAHGGIPDYLFNFPDEASVTENIRQFMQEMKTYENPLRKRRNMAVAGKVDVNQLNKFDKDMEFRQLAVYLTGVLACSMGMPVDRIMSIVGGDVKSSSGGSDLADSAYWRRISELQDYWEILLTTQMWEPYYGTEFSFGRSYKQDEVRETMIAIQKTDIMDKMLARNYPVKDEYFHSLLGIPQRFLTSGKIRRGTMNTGLNRQNFVSQNNANRGQAQQADSRQKRKEAVQGNPERLGS